MKLTVPLYDPLKKGTLKRILKDAGINEEELMGLTRKDKMEYPLRHRLFSFADVSIGKEEWLTLKV